MPMYSLSSPSNKPINVLCCKSANSNALQQIEGMSHVNEGESLRAIHNVQHLNACT